MDPTVLAAMISALIGGVAGEAGKGAWGALATLTRKAFGFEPEEAALELTGAEDPQAIAGILVERAEEDPEFRESLSAWVTEAKTVVQQRHDVANTISGTAQIHGTVIQAGDVFGSINLGPR